MEQRNHETQLLKLMGRPAFFVADGYVTQVNAEAASFHIAPGMAIADLLLTGAEEYAALGDGCLYLTLSVDEAHMGASVTRLGVCDVFCLEELDDNHELQSLALAARELRRPLDTVMRTTEQLFPVSGLEDDPDTRDQVSRINKGLYQILRVIGNMANAGDYTVSRGRMETVSITAALDEIFAKAAVLVAHTDRTLHFENHPETIYCLTDLERLERAVLNMISNAVKFSDSGSSIHAALTRRGTKLYLSVSDSGGKDTQIPVDVFTRYQRKLYLENKDFGIGLGMVLIRAAAAAHGGAVLIDRLPDGGTRVTMSMTIHRNNAQLRFNPLTLDYCSERDHSLVELSDILPDELYKKEY